jgi:hypothetical protein
MTSPIPTHIIHSLLMGTACKSNTVVGMFQSSRKDSEDLTVVEQDALLVLQTLCKMAMKGGGDEFQNRNKLLSLEILQNCIESVKYAFTLEFRFIDLLRIFVCYILLKACMSPVLPVFQVCTSFSALVLLFS